MKNVFMSLAITLTVCICGCKTETSSPAKSQGAEPATAAAEPPASTQTGENNWPGCDLAAFEKYQDEKGREAGKLVTLTGCKFKSYNEKTRTVFIDKGGASDSLSCVNMDRPPVADGDLVDISGKIDGASYLQLYGCTIKKN